MNLIVTRSTVEVKDVELTSRTSKALLEILKRFIGLIEHALSVDLKSGLSTSEVETHRAEEDTDETDAVNQQLGQDNSKHVLDEFDRAIEAKLLTIDLINSVSAFFIQGINGKKLKTPLSKHSDIKQNMTNLKFDYFN